MGGQKAMPKSAKMVKLVEEDWKLMGAKDNAQRLKNGSRFDSPKLVFLPQFQQNNEEVYLSAIGKIGGKRLMEVGRGLGGGKKGKKQSGKPSE